MTTPRTPRWDGAMLTHRGCVRDCNEDDVTYLFPRRTTPDARLDLLAVVADGMGGHAAGEVASDLAVRCVVSALLCSDLPMPRALLDALEGANSTIHAQSQHTQEQAGMGTTCTVVAVHDDTLYLGHVGDSRAYVVRSGKVHQISEDHSMVAQLVREGALSEEQAHVSPHRNIITQALGLQPSVEAQVFSVGLPMLPDDVIVLCSDGLTDMVQPESIGHAVSDSCPSDACAILLQQALDAGGYDNISVGVFALRVPPGHDPDSKATGRMTTNTGSGEGT